MDDTSQAAIDLYAPVALDHTRDQYAKAKQHLKEQSAQVIELQERLISKQADEIETQQMLIRQKGFTIIELREELERAQGLEALVREKEYTINELRDEQERARGLDEEKDATIVELQDELQRVRTTLVREKEATIQELQDELEKVRNVLMSIANATTPMRSIRASQDIQAREEYGVGRGGDDIIQQNIAAHNITSSRPATELKTPPVVPHKVPGSMAVEERSQSPTRAQYLYNNLYVSDSSNAYINPRSLSTLSLPPQPLQYHNQLASPTVPVHHDNTAAKPRHRRYASPPAEHRREPSREGGLRSSILSTSPPAPIQRSTPPRLVSFPLDMPQTATGMDHNEEEEMRKKIRAEAEKRKQAAFRPTDRIERDSTIFTYITTTEGYL